LEGSSSSGIIDYITVLYFILLRKTNNLDFPQERYIHRSETFIFHRNNTHHMNKTLHEKGTPQTVVFRDPSPLSEDFIPEKIQFREKQIQNITYYLSGLVRYGLLMNNIMIYGHPGTGKTHSIKHVLSNINQEIQAFYGRAYRATSAHSFIRMFLENNFPLSLHPRESISVYYRAFEETIKNMKNVLLVFDDIQYLLTDDPKGLDGLLSYLSRLGKNLGLILIGNIKVNDLSLILGAPTTSSLKLRSVYFPKYNAEELRNILMVRAEVALTKKALKHSRGAIGKIAALTAQGWGSARYALDLFKEAGMVSEAILGNDYITEEAVDKANEMIEVSNIEDQIRELPQHPLALLETIYRLKKKGEISTGDVYSAYDSICGEKGLKPFTLRKVSDLLTELDSAGLISCRLVSKGRHGRTRLISWPLNSLMEKIYERERGERF
jgi:cell division control protein 6